MFKDIMVHLDGSAEDESRLSFAEGLAQPFEGHITGVFTNLLPDSAWLGATDASGTVVQVLIEMEDRARAEGDRIFAHLAERLPRLAAVTELRRLEAGVYQIEQDVTALVVAGGVAANWAIRTALEDLAASVDLPLVAPPSRLCTDNAAMIGWVGAERYAAGVFDSLDFVARPRWPLDADAAPVRGAGVKA